MASRPEPSHKCQHRSNQVGGVARHRSLPFIRVASRTRRAASTESAFRSNGHCPHRFNSSGHWPRRRALALIDDHTRCQLCRQADSQLPGLSWWNPRFPRSITGRQDITGDIPRSDFRALVSEIESVSAPRTPMQKGFAMPQPPASSRHTCPWSRAWEGLLSCPHPHARGSVFAA